MIETLYSVALAALAVCIAIGLLIGETVNNLIAIYWIVLAIKNVLGCRRDEYHDSY